MIRVRFTFPKNRPDPLHRSPRSASHLDPLLSGEHILKVAHSLGFHPQPRIQMASAISLGYTGSREHVGMLAG